MKKTLIIVLFNFSLWASTNSCMLDVYFGNGVWNESWQAEESMGSLATFMQERNPEKFTINDENITYNFKYAHNDTHGTLVDLIETYWQLSEGYFTFVAHILDGSVTEEQFLTDLRKIIVQENGDTNTMYAKYQSESFSQNHNVLLVSHLQGNLFANKIYALLDAMGLN